MVVLTLTHMPIGHRICFLSNVSIFDHLQGRFWVAPVQTQGRTKINCTRAEITNEEFPSE